MTTMRRWLVLPMTTLQARISWPAGATATAASPLSSALTC